ncbi:uncharacterized protein (DUF2267 family) [Spinactinospora alkalitolerans]|uniref:Uncharacterized protein (DUF2267 family) n=1 Tax=Spinactinospora alkalitolerans TaxID=687207 RepID=A0A852U0U6_9ACTN|nr:DUF2267 domain-containing protein [Spinactinospora alkalitolerans]NYE47814.1 uncharacterized protein (DUF2267 family) [Spinactinospora alkalitolerans]
MKHDEFIGQVQARAHLDSRGAAEAATRATLETLAERINPDLADDLAAQLPVEIGEHLRRVTSAADVIPAQRFGQDEFISRVTERAHTDDPKSAYLIRVLFEVMDEATTGGIMDRIRQSLPDDLRQLTAAGSTG